MELNDSKSAGLRASAGSPPNGPLPNIPRYTGETGGPAATGNGRVDDLSRAECQQSGVTGSAPGGLAACSSPALPYRIQQQQHSQQQQAPHACGQQPPPQQQQLQNMQAAPQSGGSTSRYTEGRVDTGSPLLGSVTGAASGPEQLSHSPRQHGETFLQQHPPPPVCTSSRGSPIASTASTPPLSQVHATSTSAAPVHPYVSPRDTGPVLKDLSGLLAAMGSSGGSSCPCALAGGSTVVPFGTSGLPAVVHALGNIGGTAVDRQEEEGRAAASAAAASMQALQQLVRNGGCLTPLSESRRQPVMSADRALKDASDAETAEVKSCRSENEEAKQLLQQQQVVDKDESAFLATCSAQLEKLNLTCHRESGESPLWQQQGPTESMLALGHGGSPSFEDFLSQVHKLLRSSSTVSASSASTPRVFRSGHPTTAAPHTPQGTTPHAQATPFGTEGGEGGCKQKWDNKEQRSGPQWGHDFFEVDLRNAAVGGQATNKQEEDERHKLAGPNNGLPEAPILDIAVLQVLWPDAESSPHFLCTDRLENLCKGVTEVVKAVSGIRMHQSGLMQKNFSSNRDLQTVLMLPELHRQAAQQRASLEGSRPAEGGGGHDSDFLQNALDMLEEGKNLANKELPQQRNQEQQQQQPDPEQHPTAPVRTVQVSPQGKRRGSPQGMFPGNKTPTHRVAGGRLLAPTYQTCDEIQSAPNPSTPIIRGNDKISVEQFLMSFSFTRTVDYAHAALKFCADHNLVVKLLGYHGKRVELLERQYCCRIQTSAQASSFPGYPNGRCVLFTGGLTSLLRACSDLYAVVDTSSPGLRTNIEGYRVCLVVPGDFVGRLLRSNCAGLHALQEVGGRSVHIALGNLCVVMRGNYSERVLLIDGNLEGVCQVLEYTAAQLQDFLRRYAGSPGPALGSPQSLLTRYEFLDYPKRIELHLST